MGTLRQAMALCPVGRGPTSGQRDWASERHAGDLYYGHFKAWHVLGWVVYISFS